MAQRVATEYKNVVLELKPTELQSFITLFNNPEFNPEVRIYDNGERELVLHDNGEEIPLTFKWVGNCYHFEGESMGAEDEISWIRLYIDQLLDLRNRTVKLKDIKEIDEQLLALSKRLFVLEA
jgi:hypothetical protein